MKLVVGQLAKQFHSINCLVHNSLLLDFIVNQMNPVHVLPLCSSPRPDTVFQSTS
jgi:hypothetical protein